MDGQHVQVVTTVGSLQAAEELAGGVVEARLAACVQVLGPIRSIYRWKGSVETAEEWMCVMKTAAARFDELAAHLKERHAYETPEITALPITRGSPDYLAWIDAVTAGPG